jgi:hypothetical protein
MNKLLSKIVKYIEKIPVKKAPNERSNIALSNYPPMHQGKNMSSMQFHEFIPV